MIDSTEQGLVPADAVVDVLSARGFHCVPSGSHVVATRDGTRVVVPAPGRDLPATFVQRLEHALRPVLGHDWLRHQDHASTTTAPIDPADVVVLDAVVDRCPDSREWCAFLPSEITLMGAGSTRDDALRDLKAATALWLGVPSVNVALLTPDVV